MIVLRPAVNFVDGHRIVVGVRDLVTCDGSALDPIDTFEVFVAYRDRLDSGSPAIEGARPRFEQVFSDLESAGVERDDLQLAWDFTVASTRGLSETVLTVRDDSFERLGDAAPTFAITAIESHDDPGIARRVFETFEMPNYLDGVGGPGERFVLGDDGLPTVNDLNAVFTADFQCIVPESALSGGTASAARPVVYGHGLLGSESEVASGSQRAMAAGHNMVYCATKWYGFSEEDVPNAILEPAYPDSIDRTVGIHFTQILWDRFDTNGYAGHMTTDPLPGTPEHTVLMHVAFGDHQVSMYAADVEARTTGAAVHRPSVADGRLPDVEPQWGMEIAELPADGSVLIVWDSGVPTPPIGNEAPREGRDPHGDPRAHDEAQRQKAEFLAADGVIVDVCGSTPCEASPDE